MKSVFISHSSSDKAVADMIVESLENEGIAAWIAPRDIPGGSDYGASIMRGLRECEVFVLVFSKKSNKSDGVIREVQLAFNEKKAIIPFRIENVPVGDSLAFYLSGLHWIDAGQKSKNVDVLLKDVKGILQSLGKEMKEPPLTPMRSRAPAPATCHTNPISKRLPLLVAACALLLIVAGVPIFMNANRVLEMDLASDAGLLPPKSDAGTQLAPPATTPTPTPTLNPVQAQADVSVGEIIQFGGFDWRVLDLQDNQALIITDRVIDQRMYHHSIEHVTWETSEIRHWLNGEFFASFSPQDQARIAETYVINNNNPWDFLDMGFYANTPGGSNTTDRVFLLSIYEVLRYFGDSGLVAHGATMNTDKREASTLEGIMWWGIYDQYSQARSAVYLDGSASWWLLRSPGRFPIFAVIICLVGNLYVSGDFVYWHGGAGSGIRPALWLNLES